MKIFLRYTTPYDSCFESVRLIGCPVANSTVRNEPIRDTMPNRGTLSGVMKYQNFKITFSLKIYGEHRSKHWQSFCKILQKKLWNFSKVYQPYPNRVSNQCILLHVLPLIRRFETNWYVIPIELQFWRLVNLRFDGPHGDHISVCFELSNYRQ